METLSDMHTKERINFMTEIKHIELYHGGGEIIYFPEIRKTKYTKDFSWGFYCRMSRWQSTRI